MDWNAWHDNYQTDEELKARLSLVRTLIAHSLSAAPPGEIVLLSLCCGDARDILGSLPTHPRRTDVSGWLLDCNPTLIDKAKQTIIRHGLASSVSAIVADATMASSYAEIPPANVVILAGIFGSVEHDEIPRLIQNLRTLCVSSAFIIWTRHTREGTRQAERIQREFANYRFSSVKLLTTPQAHFYVGLNCYDGPTEGLHQEARLFTFGLQHSRLSWGTKPNLRL
jgi:hypothetical protein